MKKLLFLTLVLLVSACGSEGTTEATTDNSGSTSSSSGSTSGQMVEITTSSGIPVGSVSKNHAIRIGDGLPINSRLKGDKRKYDVPGGAPLKVTYKPDGFKVKRESGELLWKIKTYEEKIKISNNEENENPYEIKRYEGTRAKLKYQEQELGEVELEEGRQLVQGSGKDFAIGTDKFSASYAALLIEQIPLEQRLIIVSELLALGQ